jgi:crossover junction endonuclease EME1
VIDIESSSDAGLGDDGTSDDDLPDLNKLTARCVKPRERTTLSRSRSDVIPSKNRSKPTQQKKSTGERARERGTKAAAKEAEKEKKRIQREKDKEDKAREKAQAAALAEVNKVRTDKKISTPEMLVDMADSLDGELKTQVETLLEPLDVQSTHWASPVEGVIKWRRKVTSEFNEDLGRWEPVPRRIEEEKHVAVVLRADKFVEVALGEEIDDHVAKVSTAFPNHHIIYLIEGMTGWFRKNRSKRNRQFTSGVRAQESASTSSSAAPTSTAANRRRRNAASAASEYVSEDLIEDALLHLHVMHDVLIHHTNLGLETAQWIVALTQHISTIPYRKQRDEATTGAGFCMDSGQVKTGEDAADTYVKMLQEIARITAPIAWGVKAEFGSVSQLVNGLVEGGPDRLANVKKSANKNGAVSDRTIGQAVSKRLHKVFTGRDENSADV